MVWELRNNMLKPFPSLAASHTAMEVTLRLVAENDLKPADIVKIVDRTYGTVKSHFSNCQLHNVMAARLSVPFCIAVCAARRSGGLEAFTPESIHDPVVLDVLKKVEIVADPELDKLYPEKFPSRIEITTQDGKVYAGELYHAKGSPGNPFLDEETRAKFRSLALPIMDDRRVERIVETAENLEGVSDIKEFSRLFA